MLYTDLKHIENAEEFARVISENENVMLICGRMGTLCIPVYRIALELEEKYRHVKFYDMEYDNPESYFFHALPEVSDLMDIPYTVYYKNGLPVKATAGIQTKVQVEAILKKEFAATATDKADFPDLSINGSFLFGSDIKSDVTIRSLNLEGDDRNAFR